MSHCRLGHRIFNLESIPVLPQVPSPDLRPCDFFLFPKLKNILSRFATLENIQKSVTDMLKIIPVENFQRCYIYERERERESNEQDTLRMEES